MTTKARPHTQPRPAERAIELPAPDTVFEGGFYLPFNDLVLSDANEAQAVINGNLALSWLNSTYIATLDENDQLVSANAGVGLHGAVALELDLESGAEISKSLRLTLLPLPPITIEPITVSPFVQVKLHFDATSDADTRISIVAPFHIGSDFAHDGSTSAGLSSPPRFSPEVGLPDAALNFNGRVDLEIVLVLLIAIEGVEIGGPSIGCTLGTILAIDSVTGFDLDGKIEIVGGWAFRDPVTQLPVVPEHLRRLKRPTRFDIADGPLPIGGVSTRWSRVYEISGDDGAAAAVMVGDRLFVVETDQNPWLAELDEFGVPLWQYTADHPWTPKGIVAAANGDLLIGGIRDSRMRLDRFDSTGAPVRSLTLSVPDASSATCDALVQTAGNNTILAGHVGRFSVNTPLLAAIDEAGNVVWAVEVDMGLGSIRPVIKALAETPTGEIIAVGSVEYTDSEDHATATISVQNALILKFSAQGDMLGAFAFGSMLDEEASQVVVHPDGSYAIGGKLPGAPYTWIATFTASDGPSWSMAYQSRPESDESEDAEPTGLASIADNGLLVSGRIGAADEDAWLMRLDAGGMPVLVRSYISVDNADILSGVIARQNGLVAFGRTQIQDEVDSYDSLWILDTAADAYLHFTPDSGLATVNTTPHWEIVQEQSLHTLAPVATVTTLEVDPDTELVVNPASVTGELVTE